jgi:hypothetical protein
MSDGKFLGLWTKYLPVMRLLLKKSVNGDQQISLGKMELQSVDARKNVNFSFNIEISKGKIENTIGVAAIGKDLFTVLSNDAVVKSFMDDKKITIQMSRASLLTFKSSIAEPVPVAD